MLHPPSRHCIYNVFSSQGVWKVFEVERGAVFEGNIFWERTQGVFVESEHFIGGERERVTRTGHGDVGGRGRGDGGEKGLESNVGSRNDGLKSGNDWQRREGTN